ncbi:MAG: hypothetical protein DLM62_20670 [Pseudonocardiales bacterium]|nr:MAG: hypothetical protein DLM62_20670 [Pseudonocardiales bacterium]
MTFAQAAELLGAHLASYRLPEPVSVTVLIRRAGRSEVEVQLLSCRTVAEVAGELLIWADTLSTLTVQAWRTPKGDQVHLSIASTLTGPAGAVELHLYGATAYDPALFTDLAPGEHPMVSLGQLRGWAAGASGAVGGGAA